MQKFCQHCGAQLEANAHFCAACGKPLSLDANSLPDAAPTRADSPVPLSAAKEKPKWIFPLLGVAAIVVIGGGLYVFKPGPLAPGMPVAATSPNTASAKQETTLHEDACDTSPVVENLHSLQQILDQYGMKETIEATSFGHSDKGSLSIIGSSKGRSLLLVDKVNQQAAIVSLTNRAYNFTNQRGQINPTPVIFQMKILADTRGKDQNAGAWKGNDHILPIYACYTFDEQGNVIPGSLTTGKGENPSHYQGYLYEQKNVDLVNLFLTEMLALHEDAAKKHVKI